MNIKILKIILKNFKGTKSLVADFKGENVAIKGDNGTGKSTIMDAVYWTFFDKNSAGAKKFEIKTLDKDNNVIHHLDHEVTIVLLVNEKEVTLKKSYKEVWTRKRGDAEKTMAPDTTDYFINEVPYKMGEYNKYIHELVDEKIFKLLTSPLEFNNLPWKDRRTALLEIVGDVSDENVIASSEKLKRLGSLLNDRSVEDFKKTVSNKRKLLNDEIDKIPVRIDELVSSVDITGIDFTEKEAAIKNLEADITNIDFKLMDQSGIYAENNKISAKVHEIEKKMQLIEIDARKNANAPRVAMQQQANFLKSDISSLNYKLEDDNRRIDRINKEIESKKVEKQKWLDKWYQVDAETLEFKEDEFCCPTCKREYDQEKAENLKEEMEKNFNDSKQHRKSQISSNGHSLKDSIETLEKNIITISEEIKNIKTEISDKEAELKSFDQGEDPVEYCFIKTTEYISLEKEKEVLEASIKEPDTTYLEELKAEKKSKEKEIDSLKAEINQKVQFEKNQVRIQKLEDRKADLGIQMADLDGQEYLCETFIRTKVDMLEGKINSKFKNVNFRLFEELKKEGLKECCDVLVNGVPYSDVNTGGKINAGLDVINTLCDHYNVYAPIFIDGRESITNIIDVKSQVINLVVEKGAKLTIEGVE